jgi:hypothetical protein
MVPHAGHGPTFLATIDREQGGSRIKSGMTQLSLPLVRTISIACSVSRFLKFVVTP